MIKAFRIQANLVVGLWGGDSNRVDWLDAHRDVAHGRYRVFVTVWRRMARRVMRNCLRIVTA